MKIIRPLDLLDAQLIASNVVENDETEWDSSAVVIGDVRMVTTTANGASIANHEIYTANTNHSNLDPTLEANRGAGNGWDRTGTTNRWSAFNEILQELTTNADAITYEILPGETVNAVAILNANATSVTIRVNDPVEGDVYDETFSLVSFSAITEWYSYFYEPIVRFKNLVDFNLPSFPDATIFIDIDELGETVEAGEIVIGKTFVFGDSIHGSSFSITDFSTKATDPVTGAVTITPGAFQDLGDIDVKIETSRFSEIKDLLTFIRSTPIVWVADEDSPGTIIYGYYREFDIVLSGPTISDCILEIEGLI